MSLIFKVKSVEIQGTMPEDERTQWLIDRNLKHSHWTRDEADVIHYRQGYHSKHDSE